LLKFRRGALAALRPVTPCFVKVSYSMVSPTYESVEFFPWLILCLSSLGVFQSHVYIMPSFIPTDHMFKTHRHGSSDQELGHEEKVEIYARCLREAIAKQSGFKTID